MRSMTVLAGILLAGFLVGCGAQSSSVSSAPGLAPRTVTAGSVEVTITPVRVDNSGAAFQIKFDTHSGDLGLDVPAASRLVVDGNEWGGASWVGDPPGGHHRQGELRFKAGGTAQGEVRLTLSGLPAAVEATWTLVSG